MLFRAVLPQCLAWPRVEDEEGSDVWVRSVSERGRGEVLGCCSPLGRARERKGGGPRGIERGRAGPTGKKGGEQAGSGLLGLKWEGRKIIHFLLNF